MRSLALLFVLSSLISLDAFAAGPDVGTQAPPFELTDLAGSTVSLSQLQGKPVLLNFWSTLCKPCVAEMPSLNSLYLALRDKGLQVVAIAIDPSDRTVRDFVQANRIAFPILLDREKEVFFDEYAAPALPVSFLIDRNGMIIERFDGPREWNSREFKDRIEKLLKR